LKKFKSALVGLVIVASLSASIAIARRTEARWRQQEQSARQQAEALARLSTENESLSNLVAQMKSSQPLSKEQLRELLALRHEVGQLRQEDRQNAALAAQNAALRTAVKVSQKQLDDERSAPNYWPKDQLAFAGFADPVSALKTMLWSMKDANLSVFQNCCTPEARAHMEKEWDKGGYGDAERTAQIKTMAEGILAACSGFRLIDEQQDSPEKAILDVSFVGEGRARKFVLRKIGNEWKFEDLLLAGQEPPP
jgi:hypothetical protein